MLNKSNTKDIYVTGGAGLIGSYLCEKLVNSGYKVFVIDDFSKGQLSNLKTIEKEIEIIESDLQSLSQCRKALTNAKNVFHLASRAYGVGYSSKNHIETLIHNEKITTNLLEVFEDKKPDNLLITSSSCVYTDEGPEKINERPLFESEPEKVNLGYGWAKRFLEQKFILLSNINKISLKIARPFNIYGERYRWVGEYSSAIPMLVKKVLDNENPIFAWGSGKQRRSYLHAYDCARIMVLFMEKVNGSSTLNIGTEETISIAELVDLICELSGKNPSIIFDTKKPEGRFIKSSDTSNLRKIINEKIITIDIKEGIKRMFTWYEDNFSR